MIFFIYIASIIKVVQKHLRRGNIMSIVNDGSPLISANELKEMLGEENIKIFDIRGKWGSPPTSSHDDYAKGHIPGAIYLDWVTHFLEPNTPVNLASVASQAQAQDEFKVLGISPNDTVVLYDDYHHMLAGRIWWAMRYWGFLNVKVLNGGWNHWSAENLPISVDINIVEAIDEGAFIVSQQSHLRASVEEVKNRPDNVSLIDARGPINYQGNPSDPRSGHVPGAINLPYSDLLDTETGLFKDAKSLESVFNETLQGKGKANLITSCGAGYAGTVSLLALKAMGIEASLFDGSFSVWKENGALPIEQGSA
ncbi:MAG: rhodanese-like domain-containing protein [Rhodospirillales bacterium]|nr:rhodanese-like domain-containing protein [Rhodospirillales bacterium]